ncbi:MAG: hypothetical protein ABIA59_03480 [Candidatus Latescibacterota bacterium]
MREQGQMDLLLELRDLEQEIGKTSGTGKKELSDRIEGICSRIDAWVLKHYRRHKIPFGEFQDRTCRACGMVYPKTHVHCRPNSGEVRLCEGCGRILVSADDGEDAVESLEEIPREVSVETAGEKSPQSPKKTAKAKPKPKARPNSKASPRAKAKISRKKT